MNLQHTLAALLPSSCSRGRSEVGRQARMETIADAVRQATKGLPAWVYSKEG